MFFKIFSIPCSLLTFLIKVNLQLTLQIRNEVLKNINLTKYKTI